MKKNLFVVLLCFLCLISSELSAKKYYDRGFYGSLSFLYWDENVQSSTEYSQNDFLQEYKLGYMGNIYSPRLLDYKLEGLIRFENLVNKNDRTETRTKTDSQDYKVNFSFIRGSNFPFTLYASKGKRPITRIDTTGTYSYLYKTDTRGINGSMKFKPFVINYGASNSINTSESTLYDQEIKTDVYYATLKHGEDKYNYSIDYSHLTQKINNDTTTSDTNTTTNVTTYYVTRNNTDQVNDSVDLRYRLNISDTLTFNTSANWYESEFTGINSKSIGASANLQWRPSEKLTSSLTVNGRRLQNTSGDNITSSTSTFDTYSLYESLNYRVTPSINIFQSASDYIYENNSVDGDIKNFRIGASHNYRNRISGNTSFSLYSTVYMQNVTTSSTIKQVDTNDTNASEELYDSINRYNVNIKATLLDEMPAINSSLRLKVDLYNMQTSTEEAIARYSSDLQFLTKFFYIFRNNITLGVSQNETTRVRLATATNDESVETTKTSIVNASESLSFITRLGIEGRLSFLVGVKYSSVDYGNTTINRTQPMADIKLNYRLGRNLFYFASFHVDKDLIYDYTNYIGLTKLTYKIGRTSFLASYRYNKTEVGENSDRRDYQRTRLDLKLVRTF